MASFKLLPNNQVKLVAGKKANDGLNVAKWARSLIKNCSAEINNGSIAYQISASHLGGCFSPDEITLSFDSYYTHDIKEWLAINK